MTLASEAPATATNGAAVRGLADHSKLLHDGLAKLQAQRLARAGIPPHLAAIIGPVALRERDHG